MQVYLDLLKIVLGQGSDRIDRTGTGTRSIFGYQFRVDLMKGFPLLTTKRCHFKSILEELLWFIRGETNVRSLQEKGVSIWDEWADSTGELGPIYGRQWRYWTTSDGRQIDQITNLIDQIRENPNSRRLIVSAWNVGDIEKMALPPCHLLFQFYVAHGRLNCQLYQRSCDTFLGLPFNIASYAILIHLIAKMTDLQVGEFVWTGGDVHIYHNHLEQVRRQLSRTPKSLPSFQVLHKRQRLDQYTASDCLLEGYDPHPRIPAPIAV